MRLVQQHHAEAALPYAATDAEWQLSVEQLLVEIQFLACLLACNFKLAQQGFTVNTYAHRREFDRAFKQGIPYQDVAVQPPAAVTVLGCPVVIVGRAAVVRFAV